MIEFFLRLSGLIVEATGGHLMTAGAVCGHLIIIFNRAAFQESHIFFIVTSFDVFMEVNLRCVRK